MKITTYSASSGQVPLVYFEAAQTLGRLLAERGHTLINGAGRIGLMGALIDACRQAGGKTIGVIPEFMIAHGWQHEQMTELIVTLDMHTRKERMAAMGDACIALPGGIGTLEELLEIITWKQLGLYDKPIVILNIAGFFDSLLAQLQIAIDQQFMRPMHNGLWEVATTPEAALDLAESLPLWDKSLSKYAAIDAQQHG